MESFIDKIKGSFKWKKTSEYCADKLGVTIEDYELLKSWVKSTELLENSNSSYEYNLEKGVANLIYNFEKYVETLDSKRIKKLKFLLENGEINKNFY